MSRPHRLVRLFDACLKLQRQGRLGNVVRLLERFAWHNRIRAYLCARCKRLYVIAELRRGRKCPKCRARVALAGYFV